MKALAADEEPPMSANQEVVSGLSPRRSVSDEFSAQVAAAVAQMPTWPPQNGTSATEYRSASMYCFSLAIPGSYEPQLLRFQYAERTSIFACEEYALFSNKAIDVAPEVKTSLVDSDLTCDKGGEFGTALNLKIFLAVWTAVLRDKEFQFHGWTVKVDPDTVFFPRRLLGLLSNHHE